jgi:hypothetical protein
MMTGSLPHTLAGRAAAAGDATATLMSELRGCLAATLGIDLLDLRSNGVDGTWILVCRFGPPSAPSPAELDVPALPERAPADEPATPPVEEPVFVSPMLESEPFEGDGTANLMRFIEQADPGVMVPLPAVLGEMPPPLTEAARAQLLPATIAGDVVLALMHEGVANDPVQLGAALDEGWERYVAESRRLGRDPDAELFRRASEHAATMIVEGI